jgi:hypothetical protein
MAKMQVGRIEIAKPKYFSDLESDLENLNILKKLLELVIEERIKHAVKEFAGRVILDVKYHTISVNIEHPRGNEKPPYNTPQVWLVAIIAPRARKLHMTLKSIKCGPDGESYYRFFNLAAKEIEKIFTGIGWKVAHF